MKLNPASKRGPRNKDDARLDRNRLTRWMVIAGLGLCLGLAVWLFGPARTMVLEATRFLLDPDGAKEYLLSQPHAELYFVGIQALQVTISPIPGELSGFLGGLVFGWAKGFLLGTIGLTVGSLVNVVLGRALERVFLEKIIPGRILDRFEAKSKRWGLPTVFVLFLFPGAPKDTFCYLFGLTRIRILPFIIVSSVARMPGTLVLCLQGDKVIEGDWTYFIVLTVAGLVVTLLALVFKKRVFHRLGIEDMTAERHQGRRQEGAEK